MIELKALTVADVDAHNAGEDHETVKWPTGEFSTTESTRRHIEMLVRNTERGEGKRAFGIWMDGRLTGYVDFDPTLKDLPARKRREYRLLRAAVGTRAMSSHGSRWAHLRPHWGTTNQHSSNRKD